MLKSLLGERYQLIAALGAGGFGQTYLAKDTQQPDRPICVIKQFKPTKDDPEFLKVARRLFKSEISALEKLGQHPQIPSFLGFFEDGQEFYIVQEFIDGHPLSEEIALSKKLSEAEAIALLEDVLPILEFIHSRGMIHRDIKPSNLIRRQRDGKMVLIDFGAVKEIQTQLSRGGKSDLTVAIGTQGYIPSEQLAGQPRFSSDIYALGMTVIHAVSGLSPTQLSTDPVTGDPLWQHLSAVSAHLKAVLSKMVRYHFNQRYASATEVLIDLRRSTLDTTDLDVDEATAPPFSWLRPHSPRFDPSDAESQPLQGRRARRGWADRLQSGWGVVAVAALAITGLVLGVRQLGWLEPLELNAYDQMVRLRPDAGPDPRLLLVGITESDLQALQRPTPSDQDVARVIDWLSQYQPRAIGLDLHRELPQEPGHAELLQALKAKQVIAILNLGSTTQVTIPPPPGLPAEQVGFNDFPVDPDGVIRRNLLFASNESGSYDSFSVRLAFRYLAQQQIEPRGEPSNPDAMRLGKQRFLPLNSATAGGYQQLDTRGYQILLNYRSPRQPARQVAFTDVLKGKVDSAWVKDKIVIIGTVAPSSKDLFYTPYSAGLKSDHLMPGVVVHTQMVSQLLRSALDGLPLIGDLPDWVEVLWIAAWAVAGGLLAWWLRHPVALLAGTIALEGGLAGATYGIFSAACWLPGVAPAIALGGAVVLVIAYRASADSTQTLLLQASNLRDNQTRREQK